MKNNDILITDPINSAVLTLLQTVLNSTHSLHLTQSDSDSATIRKGFHYHKSWELFCPLEESLKFEVLGGDVVTYPERSLLIVPPGCMHMTIDELEQSSELQILTLNFPSDQAENGILRLRRQFQSWSAALSSSEMRQWQELVGYPLEDIGTRIASAFKGEYWEKERASALLRLLFASFMQVTSTTSRNSKGTRGRRSVTQALAILQQHYYDQNLDVQSIAEKVGLSPTHLSALFRETTGKPIHQTLIDIRMRHATELLKNTDYSIKEIAALTGWRNQLYFSSAYRRTYGISPSAERQKVHEKD